MKISRRGSNRNHGDSATEFSPTSYEWNPHSKTFDVYTSYVDDFNTDSQHDWTISITPQELSRLIVIAGGAVGGDESRKLGTAMAPALTSLLRLATESAKEVVAQANK